MYKSTSELHIDATLLSSVSALSVLFKEEAGGSTTGAYWWPMEGGGMPLGSLSDSDTVIHTLMTSKVH